MEPISATLKGRISVDQIVFSPEALARQRLTRFRSLPPTDVLVTALLEAERRLAAIPADDPRGFGVYRQAMHQVAEAKAAVSVAVERDEALTERPEGCWCFGAGGWGEEVASVWDGSGWLVDRHADPVLAECCEGCPEGQAAQATKDRLTAALLGESVDPLERNWRHMGIPEYALDFRLDNWPKRQGYAEMVAQMTGSEEEGWPGQWWYWYGLVSRGKTALMVAYLWEWMHTARQPVLFRNAKTILDELKATFDQETRTETEAQVRRRYFDAPMLAIDDLGTEHDTEWAEAQLLQIIGYRHDYGKPTVFTSNLNKTELAKQLGPRLQQRIWERCDGERRFVEIGGENLRQKVHR